MSNYNNNMNNNANRPQAPQADLNTLQNASKVTDIKPNGGKDNNSNLVIVIIILLLIALGAYFNSKNADNSDIDDADKVDVLIGDDGLDEGEKLMDEDLLNDDKTNISDDKALNTTNTKPVVDQNQANYNTAMINASKAINSGQYAQAVTFYNQALAFKKDDTAYAGLFTVYGAQGDWAKASTSIDNAIKTNQSYTDYWVSKLVMLDEKTSTSFADMKNIYQDGLTKVNLDTKVNLVTSFAIIAEKNGVITDAINIWKYAQEIYPQNSSTYQTEIDRLTLTIQ